MLRKTQKRLTKAQERTALIRKELQHQLLLEKELEEQMKSLQHRLHEMTLTLPEKSSELPPARSLTEGDDLSLILQRLREQDSTSPKTD